MLYLDIQAVSVIKTTGNRKYGNARVGERAIKVLCYASNATFTRNLLHSVVGVDYFNILPGPSNGLELLIFFSMKLYRLTEPMEVLL